MVKPGGASPVCSHSVIAALGERSVCRVRTGRSSTLLFRRSSSSSAFSRGGGIDHQPAVDRVDPGPGDAAAHEGARQQFVGDLFLQFAQLLAAEFVALLLFDFRGAILGELGDDAAGQQLLFDTQRDQHLLVQYMQQAVVAARRNPALAFHVHDCRRAAARCAPGRIPAWPDPASGWRKGDKRRDS
jgi:hypothetical protein